MCGEGCGRVYGYGVSGEVCWLVGKGCGERNGGGLGKCVRVWGPNTLPPTLPLISLTSPFPTFPFTSPTFQHTFLHLLLYLFPHLPSSCTPTHFPTIPTYLPSSSQSVAKLPCDEVSVAKLLWRSYHVAKLLATHMDKLLQSVNFINRYAYLFNKFSTFVKVTIWVELNTVWDRMGSYDRMGTLTLTHTVS